MQRERDGNVAQDMGGRIQTLMEEYLRLKVAEVESSELRAADRPVDAAVLPAPTSYAHRPTPEALKQRVVDGMAPMVEAIARRYMGDSEGNGGRESLEDLISEGYVGLLTAIDQYQGDRGARFSTYATHRIHGQIRHYLRDRGNRRLIRAPSWLQELTSRLHQEETQLLAELGRPATPAELAERLNVQEEAVAELVARHPSPVILSLTEGAEDDEDGVDLSKLRGPLHVSWQLPVEERIFLEAFLSRLKELERTVIQLFFFQEFSQSEIARSLNVSCNYVGYLLNNGLRRLRKLIETDELRDAHLRINYTPWRPTDVTGVIDSATGLYNAGHFRSRLGEEMARACRYGRKLAVVIARVSLSAAGDGHSEQSERQARATPASIRLEPSEGGVSGTGRRGDRAKGRRGKTVRSLGRSVPSSACPAAAQQALLRELGVALRECLRKADIPACLGEGTFAVALPHTGDGAAAVAERVGLLLSQVSGCPARCGIAVYPADARELGALLEIAAARAQESGAPRAAGDELTGARPSFAE